MVISTVNQVVYNGDGVTTAWPYMFRIIDDTDIKLTIIDEDGTETDVASDYYVDTVNNTVYYPGYAPGAEPPAEDQPPVLAVGQKLVVYREIPITQEKDLGEKWPFEVIELGLDKLTMILQQMFDWWGRSLKFGIGWLADHPGFNTEIPIEAGKTWRVNDAGTGFVASASSEQAMSVANQAKNTADAAALAAGGAVSVANEAKNTADGIAGTASDALTAANNAVNTANGAVNTANAAKNTADGISGTATLALSTANAANSKADTALANFINVKTYGATGDGVTDDTEAIKDAIAANKNIFFPAGTYIVTEPIGIPSNVWIRGAGKGATIIKTDDATDAIYHTVCTSNAVAITARSATNDDVDTLCPAYVEYAKISDMTINGNAYNRPDIMRHASPYTGYEAGTAVEFQRCRNCEIVNVEVINGPQHNINVRAGAGSYNQGNTFVAKYPSQYVTIDGCNTDNEMLDDAITTHDSEYIYINNCQAFLTRNTSGTNTTPVSNGIEIDDGSRYVWVTNCLSDGGICGYQAKGHANTPPAHHVWFKNCVARNNHFGFNISTGTAVTTEGVLDGTCHDITVDGCKIENVYQKKGMTSWQNECNYISMLNVKNVKVHDLNVVGKTGELSDYSTNNRCAYFRHRDYCENIIYENIHITEADYNITTGRPLFNFEAYTKRLYLRQIFCDSYTTGSIVNYTSNSILECKDINILTTSNTYVPITVNSLSNTLVERVAFGGNTVAVNSGNFYEQDNVVNNNSITAPVSTTTAVPLRLVGALDRTETTVPVGRSVALRFGLTNNAGNIVNEALVSARTRADSPYTDPGSAGTNLSFYVRDTDGTLKEQTILNSTTLMPSTDNVMSLGLATNRWNTLYTYGIDMNNFRLDVSSANKLRFNNEPLALEKDFLPLSGGTMTGNAKITMGNGNSFISSYSTGLVLSGDTDTSNATQLVLYTKANGNGFLIDAGNGTARKRLIGKPDGTLTWDGTNVCVASSWSVVASDTVDFNVTMYAFAARKSNNIFNLYQYISNNATHSQGDLLMTFKTGYRPVGNDVRIPFTGYDGASVYGYVKVAPDGKCTIDSINDNTITARICFGGCMWFTA